MQTLGARASELGSDPHRPWLARKGSHYVLAIYLQPGASLNEITGVHGRHLKVRVRGRAHQGAANRTMLAFLASELGLAKRDVELVSGAAQRQKRVRVLAPQRYPSWWTSPGH